MILFWLLPLLVALALFGGAAGLIWFFASGKSRRPNIGVVVAVPIGCVAIPIVGLMLLAAVDALLQKSDTQLYEEIFGDRSTLTEDRMLFDDFGSGADRQIFMRAEPTDAERRRMLAIAGSAASDLTLNQFVGRGMEHGFMWWMSAYPHDIGYCKSARIIDARGFRGWKEFLIAECLEAGDAFPASTNVGEIYVVARYRTE